MLLIRSVTVFDAIHEDPFVADILIKNGKFEDIGDNLPPDGAQVIDGTGLYAFPGFIDAHSHLGMDGYGIGYEGADYNEMNDIVSPQLRAIDGFKPMQPSTRAAVLAGVTTVVTGPGSANVLGGTFIAVKTVGRRADDMLLRDNVAMKCAFGEKPKRVYRDKADSSRMTTASKLREALFKAREYMTKLEAAGYDASKKPGFDMKMEALLPVLRGEMPLKAHAHATDDIFTALRIPRELDVKITLEHVTEGHLIVEELAQEKVPLAIGPTLSHASKFELRNITFETPGILAKAGCDVSIITDAPVIPQEYLPLCAGLAVKSGMDRFDALKAITINPARHAGIDDRVGSIEVGKDADLVLTNGCPFEVATVVKAVYVNGKKVEA
ncbi:MAG: amidohydrolase [Clostridiales bacterium]|nr:amidohydrolase [Clostridiales bacterium]